MANDREVAFPTLTAKDLAALDARGQLREVKVGEVLFAEGDRNLPFFVVLEGAVERGDRTMSWSVAGGVLLAVSSSGSFAAAVRSLLLVARHTPIPVTTRPSSASSPSHPIRIQEGPPRSARICSASLARGLSLASSAGWRSTSTSAFSARRA